MFALGDFHLLHTPFSPFLDRKFGRWQVRKNGNCTPNRECERPSGNQRTSEWVNELHSNGTSLLSSDSSVVVETECCREGNTGPKQHQFTISQFLVSLSSKLRFPRLLLSILDWSAPCQPTARGFTLKPCSLCNRELFEESF